MEAAARRKLRLAAMFPLAVTTLVRNLDHRIRKITKAPEETSCRILLRVPRNVFLLLSIYEGIQSLFEVLLNFKDRKTYS